MAAKQRVECRLAMCVLPVALAIGGWTGIAAASDWKDSRASGQLVCRADFPLAGLDPLLDELGRLRPEMERCLGVPLAAGPIELYLLSDKETYARYLKQYLPPVPYRRALYVKARGPGMVFAYRSPQLAVDLRHECAHAVLHAAMPEIPLWLDEGLAKYFEVPGPRQACDNPLLADIQYAVGLGMVPRLEDLECKTGPAEMSWSDYRDAWAWVHFMLWGPAEARDELIGYLSDARTAPPLSPLSTRLKRRLGDPSARFAAHFRTWKR